MISSLNCPMRRSVVQALHLRGNSSLLLLVCRGSNISCKPPQSDNQGCGCGGGKGGGGKSGGKHNIQYKPYVAPCYKDHDHKNMGLKRPMSPHLTIYAPTLPAMTSIAQRITGVYLAFTVFSVSFATLFFSNGVDSIVSMIQSLDLSRPSLLICKMILGAPFAFHYFFGIRFIAWNAGKWLSMKQVYATAKTMGIAAVVTMLLFALR